MNNNSTRIEIVTSAKEDVSIATQLFNNATNGADVERATYLLKAAEIRLDQELKLAKAEGVTAWSKEDAEKTYRCSHRGCTMVLKVLNLAETLPKLGGQAWFQKALDGIILHTVCPKCSAIDSFKENTLCQLKKSRS